MRKGQISVDVNLCTVHAIQRQIRNFFSKIQLRRKVLIIKKLGENFFALF